jgi:hypothetical protein
VKWRNAEVFTISEISRQRMIESGLFGRGAITLLPNTFYAFERLLRGETPARQPAILLCTGSTANKDLETVVADYLPAVMARGWRVSIFGLHKAGDMPKFDSLQSFVRSGQLRLCGQLSDRQVADEYRAHTITWVHSLREGFGRCVVEGRLAGGRVIATDIPEFAALRDSDVYLYKDAAAFMSVLDRVAQMDASALDASALDASALDASALDAPAPPYSGYPYRELLRDAVERGLSVREGRSAAQPPQAISFRQATARRTPPRNQNP